MNPNHARVPPSMSCPRPNFTFQKKMEKSKINLEKNGRDWKFKNMKKKFEAKEQKKKNDVFHLFLASRREGGNLFMMGSNA